MSITEIFDLIDQDIAGRFEPDSPEDFNQVLSCRVSDKIFDSMEDELIEAFGDNYDEVYCEIIAPGIEEMYREQRLEEWLSHLVDEYVHEKAMEDTYKTLMPGMI